MKSNAWIRIVVLSIVFIILLGILLAGLCLNSLITRRDTAYRRESSDSPVPSDERSFSEKTTASADIRDIEIKWVLGNITIEAGDVDHITYRETEVSDSRFRMVTKMTSGELEIIYRDESFEASFPFFGTDINVVKDLAVTVPRDMLINDLEIEAASAKVTLRNLSIRKISLDTASGKCYLEGCSVGELDIDTASGDIYFNGTLEHLDFDAASAKFSGVLTEAPRSLKMDSMSGDIDITLPQDAGFTVSMDAISGDLTCEFETSMRNGAYICGNGECRIEYNGMSGDITIRKGK